MQADEEEEDAIARRSFAEAMAYHLGGNFPKEKHNCSYIAKEYVKVQVRSNEKQLD
jgi:hypothetical protein